MSLSKLRVISIVFMLFLLSVCVPVHAETFTPDENGHLIDTSGYIYAETYKGRTDIKSVSLPNATYIGDSAFEGCTNLMSVDAPKTTEIGASGFYNCKSLESVSADVLQQVGERSFSNCSGLVSIEFPSLIEVDDYAFQSCLNLEKIDAERISSVGLSAFQDCKKLYSFPFSNLCSVYDWAFMNTAFTEAYLPNVTHFYPGAFDGCEELLEVSLPNATTLNSISHGKIFDGCTSLHTLRMDSLRNVDAVFATSSLKHLAIPSATNLYSLAFQYCSSLETLVVGNDLIGNLQNKYIPNNSALTVYVPENQVQKYKDIISVGSSLETNVVGHDGVVLKNVLFFPSTGGIKNAVISNGNEAQFWFKDASVNLMVNEAGDVSVQGLNQSLNLSPPSYVYEIGASAFALSPVFYFTPVDPSPPRFSLLSDSTLVNSTSGCTGMMRNWHIRSFTQMNVSRIASAGNFHTSPSPQYELSITPMLFVCSMPKFLNVLLRGTTCASYPSGNCMDTPREISLYSPACMSTSSAARKSIQSPTEILSISIKFFL